MMCDGCSYVSVCVITECERDHKRERERERERVLIPSKNKNHLDLEDGLFQTTTRLFNGPGELTSRNNKLVNLIY